MLYDEVLMQLFHSITLLGFLLLFSIKLLLFHPQPISGYTVLFSIYGNVGKTNRKGKCKAAAGAAATPLQSPARSNKRAAEPLYSANIINLTCAQSTSAYKSPPDPELSAETY